MKCFYHSDLDGYCSGAIVKLNNPECEMIEINYGQSLNGILFNSYETIYVVDFSFDDTIMQMFNENADLIWIDHHKTAIEKITNQEQIKGIREVGKAGCELTWQYFHPDKEMPRAVYFLGRYDVWDKSVVDAWPFQLGMGLSDWNPNTRKNIDNWNDLLYTARWYSEILADGQLINKYQTQQNTNKAKRLAYEVEFEGLKFIAMNWLGNSQCFDSVYNPSKHDGMLTYIWDKDKWSYSLYGTNPDIDLSVIAKRYGGGGHKHACGFQNDRKLV